ncbi:MAG: efflux RND transporter periplasmic adaptor subunit [Bacteroidota bacterium]
MTTPMNRSRPTRLFYRWATLMLAPALFLSSCAEPPPPTPIPAVRTAVAHVADVQTTSYAGTTQATVESRVAFQVGGAVQAVRIDVGDRVMRGMPIAVLDDADFQLRQQQAQAALKQAEAQAALAESEFARIQALYADGVAPVRQYDQARAGVETARSGVEAAADQARLAERFLNYATLTAPVTGAVAQVLVEPGEVVAPGQPIALITTQGTPMEVTLTVPEQRVAGIAAGDAVTVQLSAFAGETFQGRVTRVGVAPGRAATTFPVIVQLDNRDARIKSGMAARVVFGAEEATDSAPVVPITAVQSDAQGTYVLLVDAGSASTSAEIPASPASLTDREPTSATPASAQQVTLVRQAVRTGELMPGGVEILDGLAVGDRVVAAGVAELGDGQTVRLLAFDPLATDAVPFVQR